MGDPSQNAGGRPRDWDRGGPNDGGERSISGRACLPLLIVMIGLAALLTAGLGHLVIQVIT